MSIINTAGQVAATITERLERIKTSSGFETDVGTKVFRGRDKVPDELVGVGCVLLLEGIDRVLDSVPGRIAQVKVEQPYLLVAYVPLVGEEEPNDAGHRALRDMKKVIFDKDATFGGQVRQVKYLARQLEPRAAGSSIAICSLEIAVEYVETLYQP